MSVFDSYSESYNQISGEITREISALANGDADAQDRIEPLLEDATSALKQMQIALRSAPPDQRDHWRSVHRRYADDLRELREEVARAKRRNMRSELFSGHSHTVDIEMDEANENTSAAHRRYAEVGRTEQRSTMQLRQAHRDLVNTEEVAHDTIVDLRRQRQVIEDVADNLDESLSLLGRAKRTLRIIHRRNVQEQLLWICVIIVLLTCISLLFYFKIIHRGGKNSDSGGKDSPQQ
ncbi:MAG: hypothetical protein MHM6MM_001940 [Cercozoa sp. M6MM]